MAHYGKFAEEKARDALLFEPLPPSPWVKVGEKAIYIQTNYSEPLSRLLKLLPSSRWDPDKRRWQYPFASGEAIRGAIPEINRLAAEAKQSADMETQRREEERREREAERRTRETARQFFGRPRLMTPDFLYPQGGRPRFALVIEAIGDEAYRPLRGLPFGVSIPPRNWVAQITGKDGRGKWSRSFLHGSRDYSNANSVGSRGIMVTYLLDHGPVYEISSPQTWHSTDRYFVRIDGGKLVRMTEDEVIECLVK